MLLNIAHVETKQAQADKQALLDDLRRGHSMKLALAAERQLRTAKIMRSNDGEVFAKGGLGVRVMTVDPVIYAEMVRLYGPECWRDAEFRRDMCKHHPEMKVNARSRKIMTQVDGLKA